MGGTRQPKDGGTAILNRELSWLQFNRRVQTEADQPQNPLLERAKFLAIVTSNLDEYMQVRYPGVAAAAEDKKADRRVMGGLTAKALYRKVNKEILSQNNMQYLLYEGICSELYLRGVRLYPLYALSHAQSQRERELFDASVRPFVKILRKGAALNQKQLHLCVKLQKGRGKKARFAIVAIPASLPRLYDLSEGKEAQCLIGVEDMVKHSLNRLFPRDTIEHFGVFRVLRNQDFELENGAEGMETAVRQMLNKRRYGAVMRLEAEERMSEEMLTWLMKENRVPPERRYRVTGPLDLNKLMMCLYGLVKRPEMKFEPAAPVVREELMGSDVFDRIARRDYLLYHPYHSFEPVIHLLQRAAEDPSVVSVQQTLYRVSGNSPIVAALAKAAENGKRVYVLFESQARFDEENNLFWGERLRRAGCQVSFGFPGLKCHSKILLIERESRGRYERILHLGTGNYHDGTAKLYTDFGLFTADKTLCADAAAFFEGLRGSDNAVVEELVKAPQALQTTLLQFIDREKENAEAGLPCGILAKMNSLCDEPIMEALCDAGRAGVPVDLIVRGICCLPNGGKGLNGNVRVRSLVGRHLEHARAFRFENGGDSEIYLSSADWMPRNLYKRVELMFPVKDPACKKAVENVLRLQLMDDVKCRVRLPDGVYAIPGQEGRGLNAQEIMLRDIDGIFSGAAMPSLPEAPEGRKAEKE